MEELIELLVAKAGIDGDAAEKTVGAMGQFLRNHELFPFGQDIIAADLMGKMIAGTTPGRSRFA